MFSISSDFVGVFKIGDNINHNLRIQAILYKHYEAGSDSEKRFLCKPIISINASVAEAVLADFFRKINILFLEGIKNVSRDVRDLIMARRVDEFGKYIDRAKDHGLLVGEDKLYERLHHLRELRNRIHIQNDKFNYKPADEWEAFTKEEKKESEEVVEILFRLMATEYIRENKNAVGFVTHFILPWDARFADKGGDGSSVLQCPHCSIPHIREDVDRCVCWCGKSFKPSEV